MYSQEIEAIHHAFATAGDELLEQANQIIAGTDEQSVSKVNRLKALGFTASRQVTQTAAQLQKHADAKVTAAIVQDYATRYPNQKFITKEQVEQICSKYKLVCGPISNYTGFVPEKNLQEIEEFKLHGIDKQYPVKVTSVSFYSFAREEHKKPVVDYLKSCNSILYMDYEDASSNTIEYHLSNQIKERTGTKAVGIEGVKTEKIKNQLEICAPVTDFDTSNLSVSGKFMGLVNKTLFRTVPDPVVLQPVKGGFLTVSLWGDEANDPLFQ